MEQHRTLLIIVSISVVLAAIIGVGIWLFYPRDAAPGETATTPEVASGGLEWEPADYLLNDGAIPGLDTQAQEEPDEFQVTYGVVQDQAEPGSAGQNLPGAAGPRVGFSVEVSGSEQTTGSNTSGTREPGSQAPATQSAGSTAARTGAASSAQSATSGTGSTASGSTASTSAASTTTQPSTSSSAARPPSTSSTAQATPATSSQAIADKAYWVQVISSPNRDTVEQAQLTLREHQLGSRILTKDINGSTYYRLRLGPFAVRAEAEKFLGWVVDIDGFADSMIFVDYTTTVLAGSSS